MLVHALLLLVSLPDNSRIVLSGTVLDANGKSVAGAMVVVAEGPPAVRTEAQRDSLAAPRAPDVLATATSDNSGEFNIAMPDEMPEIAWRRTRLTVWCYHPNHALAVRLIDRDWPRAGLPLTIRLPVADNVRFKTTDAGYQPVPHARVAPLRVAGHLVPAILRDRLIAETDENGRAMLAGITPADLETVRVESRPIGVQWAGLPAEGRDKIVLLRLPPVGRLSGRLSADDSHAVARRTVRFATWQIPDDEHAGGGLAEVVTDNEGNFDVPAIAAGSLTFEIMEDGLPSPSPSTLTASKGHLPDTAPVYLAVQTTGPPIEAGKTATFDIPLRRAVAVVQEVRDEENDAPIAGVRVSMRSGQWGVASSGDTDASGRVRLLAVPGSASPMPIRIPSTYYDSTAGRTAAANVADKPEAVSLNVLHLTRGAALHGEVIDANGRPLAGAEVAGFWKTPSNREISVHTWSDARGEFTIDAVAPGMPVSLWARHDDSTTVKPVFARPGGRPVSLMVGKEEGVSLEGRVIDTAGRPVAGASVRVCGRQWPLVCILFRGNDRLLTDAQGWFRTPPSLRPSAIYTVEAAAPGLLPCHSEPIEPESWHTTHFTDMVLHAAPRLRAVSGRVLDRRGRAVEGAIVSQSGDGPRRTQTISDTEGRFQLDGLYDTPALLFVRKDGFRLQGDSVAPDDKTSEITLLRCDEPPEILRTLPPMLSMDEERELAMSLIEPSLPMLHDPVLSIVHHDLLRTLARVDPERALEVADTLADDLRANLARTTAVRTLLTSDFDAGLAAIARLDKPALRVQECVFACYELLDAAAERRTRLLEEALVHARAEPDPGLKVSELGHIGLCRLDLDERQRGVAILREGQTLAEALPEPSEENLRLSAYRGAFAGMLARIDTAAALRLLEGFGEPEISRYRTRVAGGLADHDPAEAERVFRLIHPIAGYFWLHLAPLARMAAADAPRATRLARTLIDPNERAFALGTVAHGLASGDRAAATELLEEAFGVLDGAHQLGPTQYGRRDAAVTAAALLPVAEKIDAVLVEGYLWRALSLRGPWPAPGDLARSRDTRLAQLAALVSRYDRGLARNLLTDLTAQLRETLAEGASIMSGLAMTDPRWAAELVWALPDVSAPPGKNPKLSAARGLAATLALPRRGYWGAWEYLYRQCFLRDPDTLDYIW